MKRVILPCIVMFVAATALAQPALLPIRDFVHKIYVDSSPYEDAIRYDRSVVPTLLSMLQDAKEEPYWGNIVITTGIIADPASTAPLIRFLTSGEGTISTQAYIAKSNVLLALGYIANRSKDAEALAFLQRGVDPAMWEQLRWTAPPFSSQRDRDEQLVHMAVLGLALTGQPSAYETLTQLQRSVEADPQRFRSNISETIKTALHDLEIIRAEGLLGYYRRARLPEGTRGTLPDNAPLPVPENIVTGAQRQPEIVTQQSAPPQLPPRAAMKRPKLPPKPAKAKQPSAPKPARKQPPRIQEPPTPQPR